MTTTVSARGQVVIPVRLRTKYHITPSSRLEWIDTGTSLALIPMPEDPLKFSRGMLKGSKATTASLLSGRAQDRDKEDKKFARRKK